MAGHLQDVTGTPATPIYFAAAFCLVTLASLLGFRLLQHRLQPMGPTHR